jgi:hypothetical protein
MKLQAVKFIRRFLLHVVPLYFVRIRHYGFLANRVCQEKLALCRSLLGGDAASERLPRVGRAGRGAGHSRSLSLVRQGPNGDHGDASVASDPSNAMGAGAAIGAGWNRYVLIPFDAKETNRLITGAESTVEEATVDSLSFESKSKLGTPWPMIRQCGRRRARVKFRRVGTTLSLRIAA